MSSQQLPIGDSVQVAMAIRTPGSERIGSALHSYLNDHGELVIDTLRLTCTDLDAIASAVVPVSHCTDGSALIPAALLRNLVGKAWSDDAEIVVEDTAHLTMGSSEADLSTYDVADWPRVAVEADTPVVLTEADVAMVLRCGFSTTVASDLSSILRCYNFDGRTVSTCSQHRAVIGDLSVEVPSMKPPAGAAITALKALGASEVAIGFDDSYATFARVDGSLTWRVRTFAYDFPNIEQFYAVKRDMALTFDRLAAIAAIKQVDPLTGENINRPVRLDFDNGELVLSTKDKVAGTARVALPADGALPGVMALNSGYFTDALKALTGEQATLQTAGAMKPTMFAEPGIRLIVMPIAPNVVGG